MITKWQISRDLSQRYFVGWEGEVETLEEALTAYVKELDAVSTVPNFSSNYWVEVKSEHSGIDYAAVNILIRVVEGVITLRYTYDDISKERLEGRLPSQQVTKSTNIDMEADNEI